jgi:predicted SnoaL-like aldol condensation-catalyzing enzyme
MEDQKRAALHFLQLVSSGKIDEGYEQYIDMNGKHHNPYYAAGFTALKKGMKESDALYPDKTMSVKHVLGDGDLVAVHSHVQLKAGEIEVAVVHLFRFDEGKIVEMWDCGVQIPADSPNTDGVF